MITTKMTNLMKYTKQLRFLIVGGTAAVVEYGLFLVLHSTAHSSLFIANTFSFIGGLLVSFALNKTWVFASKGRGHVQFMAYCALALINLCISNAIVLFTVDYIGTLPWIAKFVAMGAIAIWNYVIFSRLIFKAQEE